jgi:hypothetical protein
MTSGYVMSKADDFRQYAEEALRSATEPKFENQRQALIDLACTWMQAALKAEASASNSKPPKYAGSYRAASRRAVASHRHA